MSGQLIDELGRALAQPISRRRTMRLMLAGGAALALPPLRPRLASAQGVCFQRTGCATIECVEFDVCCVGPDSQPCPPPGNPFGACCPPNVGCCNPCEANHNTCSGGECIQGENTCDQCCKKRRQGECSDKSAYKCCNAGEIFTGSRCCTPRIAPDPCNSAEPRCRNRVFNKQKAAIAKCNRQHPFQPVAPGLRLPKDPAAYANCVAKAEANNEPRRLCPRVPDSAQCDGPCDRGTLTCSRDCEPNSRTPADANQVAAERRPPNESPIRRRRDAVSNDQLLRRLRAGQPRLRRSYLALVRLLQKPVVDEPSAEGLAAAYGAHRSDLLRLRASLARGRGGRSQRLLLAMLDSEAAGLAAYRQSVLATSATRSASLRARGSKALVRAETQTTRVRRALGCDQYSC